MTTEYEVYVNLTDAIICRNRAEAEYRKLRGDFVSQISMGVGSVSPPARLLTKEDMRQLRLAHKKRAAARKAEIEALEAHNRSNPENMMVVVEGTLRRIIRAPPLRS